MGSQVSDKITLSFSLFKSYLHCWWDSALSAVRTFRPDYSVCWDMGTRVEAWPGLCLETLCLRLSVSAQMSGFWGWVGFSGNRALLWVGFPGPPRGQCCGRAPSLSPARFTFPGAPGDPSGGPPGNHSNVPAHSGWVGRQVHLVNWFQATGIGHKVNGQQVRLLLCSPSRPLSPPKRTELPLVFQPSSLVFSAPQRDKKDRACQNQGSVFTSSMSFQTSKKSHRTKVKTGGAWLLRDNWGERR